MTKFDPKSLIPPFEMRQRWRPIICDQNFDSIARWGAQQAADALKHQMPTEGFTEPPTEADGDDLGAIQYLNPFGRWAECQVSDWGEGEPLWLHCPGWQPKPAPSVKERALIDINEIRAKRVPENGLTDRVLAALALVPDDAEVGE